MTLPVYPKYRESKVDWLDAAPSHWTDTRLRFVTRLNPSKSEVADRDRSEEVSFLPMDAIGDDGSLRLEQTRPLEEVETGYTFFRDGDVAVAKITPCFENGKGAVMRGLVGGVGFGTTELIVARPLPGNSPDFLHWLFTSTPFRKLGEGSMYGAGGQKRVADDFVRDFRLALPPPEEQAAIAAFLDREIAKIDVLVEAQRRLISLLKEKREAVIARAVTKGLDPAVPMKGSGVEWLGDVPAHWTVRPLKYLVSLRSGGTPAKDNPDYWNGEVPWASAKDMKVEVLRETIDHLTDHAVSTGAASLHPAGAVVVLVRGMMLARLFPVCELAVPMAINQDLKALLPRAGITGSFLAWALRGTEPETLNRLDEAGHGTKALRMEAWLSLPVAVPPKAEQARIAEALSQITGRLDAMGRQAERTINLLVERRGALITAAVTGKIDLRHRLAAHAASDQATARRLVGATVLELVADSPASSRMTSAKRMYLAETHAGVWELRGQPQRMAAGPFDGALMGEVESELARVGHIATSQPGGPNSQVHYRLTGQRSALRAELNALLGDRRIAFDKMLADLGGLESRGVEAVATLFAVWNDMLIDGKTPTDDAVMNGVLNDWHVEKRDKFTKADLRNYLGWMRRHGMTPTGRGPRTKSGTLL